MHSYKIIQLFGWKNGDVFDILMGISTDEIKGILIDLRTKYYNGKYKIFDYANVKWAQDLYETYNKNDGKLKKPKLVNNVDNENTFEHIIFNLYDIIRILNDKFKLLSIGPDIYMHTGYILTSEYQYSTIEFNFTPSLENINKLYCKMPSIFTKIVVTEQKDYYSDSE